VFDSCHEQIRDLAGINFWEGVDKAPPGVDKAPPLESQGG
jgi:hypothetical protein